MLCQPIIQTSVLARRSSFIKHDGNKENGTHHPPPYPTSTYHIPTTPLHPIPSHHSNSPLFPSNPRPTLSNPALSTLTLASCLTLV